MRGSIVCVSARTGREEGRVPLFHSHQKSNRKKKNTHIKFDRKYIIMHIIIKIIPGPIITMYMYYNVLYGINV